MPFCPLAAVDSSSTSALVPLEIHLLGKVFSDRGSFFREVVFFHPLSYFAEKCFRTRPSPALLSLKILSSGERVSSVSLPEVRDPSTSLPFFLLS